MTLGHGVAGALIVREERIVDANLEVGGGVGDDGRERERDGLNLVLLDAGDLCALHQPRPALHQWLAWAHQEVGGGLALEALQLHAGRHEHHAHRRGSRSGRSPNVRKDLANHVGRLLGADVAGVGRVAAPDKVERHKALAARKHIVGASAWKQDLQSLKYRRLASRRASAGDAAGMARARAWTRFWLSFIRAS